MSTITAQGEPIVVRATDNEDQHLDEKVEAIQNLAIRQGWKLMAVVQASKHAVDAGMKSLGANLWEMQTKECSCACCGRCALLTVLFGHMLVILPIAECINCCKQSSTLRTCYGICRQGMIMAQFMQNGRLDAGFTGLGIQYRAWSEIGNIEINHQQVVQVSSARGNVVQEGQVLGTSMPLFVDEPDQVHSLLMRIMVKRGRCNADLTLLTPLTEKYQEILNDAGTENGDFEEKHDGATQVVAAPPVYVTAPAAGGVGKRVLVYIEGRENETKKLMLLDGGGSTLAQLHKKVADTYAKSGVEIAGEFKLVNVKFNVEVEDAELVMADDVLVVRTVI
eukprot:TRINITY_DN1396_c0_g2_i1.p1 TRINITY_DN1396_c0_g2~~TRINITY_DN1396_c0_g2_i1.p1  ORF type:complete len:336 (-),score=95.56 TRINITY_DN1396_c0_g2_i1:192-1199(-)